MQTTVNTGDLGVPEIGKVIKFATEDGALVQDELSSVVHFVDITYIRLKTVVPDGALRQQMVQFANHFRVEVDQQVEVFDV